MSIVQFIMLRPWRWERLGHLEETEIAPRIEIRRSADPAGLDTWFFFDHGEHGNIKPYDSRDVSALLDGWAAFLARVEANRHHLDDQTYWPFHADLAECAPVPDRRGRIVGRIRVQQRSSTSAIRVEIDISRFRPGVEDFKGWLDQVRSMHYAILSKNPLE